MPIQWTSHAIDAFKEKYRPKGSDSDPRWKLYPIGAEHDFGWWSGYFWKEAINLSNSAPEPAWQNLLNTLYAAHITGIQPPPVKPASGGTMAQQIAYNKQLKLYSEQHLVPIIQTNPLIPPTNDAGKKGILTQLLNMGFIAMTKYRVERRPVGGPGTTERFLEDLLSDGVFKHSFLYNSASQGRIPLIVGFRGEGRNFATVVSHGGAKSKADVGLENTHAAWHPFSDLGIRETMYYRKGSGDNCLYTVISVADDYPIAFGFPLIEDEQIYQFPRTKSINTWTPTEIDSAKNPPLASKKSSVSIVKAKYQEDGAYKVGYFLGTENYLYLTKISGLAVHTQRELESRGGKKNQCRERGVRGINLEDFLVGFRIRRVHLGPNRTAGIFGFIQERKYFYKGVGAANGTWHDTINEKLFADFHFNGDLTATKEFLQYLKTELPPLTWLKGETEVPARIKITEIQTWGVDFSQKDSTIPSFNLSLSVSEPSAAFSTQFPHMASGFTYSFSDEPILINGMKVIFDQPVPLQSVKLQRKDKEVPSGY